MTKSLYTEAMEGLRFSDDLDARIRRTLAERRAWTQGTGMARRLLKRPLIAAAVLILALALCTGAALAAASILRSMKEETAAQLAEQLARTDAENAQRLLDAENGAQWASETALDAEGAIDGFALRLDGLLHDTQGGPEQASLCFFGTFAQSRDDVWFYLDHWRLFIDGGAEIAAEAVTFHTDADGEGICAFRFPYAGEFRPGMRFRLLGVLASRDNDGNAAGEAGWISMEFTFTQEQADAVRAETAAILAEADRRSAERAQERLTGLPESFLPVNLSRDGVTLTELAERDGTLYFGLAYGLTGGWREGVCELYVDGDAELWRTEVTVLREDHGGRSVYLACTPIQKTFLAGEDVLIALVTWPNGVPAQSPERDRVLLLRYDRAAGTVRVPADASEDAAWFQEFLRQRTARKLPVESAFRLPDQRQGEVGVSDVELAFSDTSLHLRMRVDGVINPGVSAYYRAPAVTVNGRPLSLLAGAAGTSRIKFGETRIAPVPPYGDDGQPNENADCAGEFYLLAEHLADLPDAFPVTVTWELCDFEDGLTPYPVGTFTWSATVKKTELIPPS